MNGSTLVKVGRFHLTDRISFTVWPWAVLAFDFAVNMAVAASGGGGSSVPVQSGAVAAIFLLFLIIGALSIFRSLPFALALGVGRRSYYAGTVLLAVALAALYGLVLAALQVAERVSDGWGVGLHFFRVPYILAGPWYLTWLTSFVGLALMFVYGMWYGLVYRRWNLSGLLVFGASQVVVAGLGALAANASDAWTAIGHFFTLISAAGLSGLLAGLAVVLLAGGYATMRRVTV
jgi:hypothetical protein